MDYSHLKYRVEGSTLGSDPDLAYDEIRHYLLFESRHDDLFTVRFWCEQIAFNRHCRVIWL